MPRPKNNGECPEASHPYPNTIICGINGKICLLEEGLECPYEKELRGDDNEFSVGFTKTE